MTRSSKIPADAVPKKDVAADAAPTITTQPLSHTVVSGQSVVLQVSATGSIVGYQWRKNNAAVVGATSATYTIDPVADRDAGVYSVVVVGSDGTSAADRPFPEADDSLLAADTVEIAVQIAGKVRARIRVPVGAPADSVEAAAMAESNGGKDPQPDAARTKRSDWLVVVGTCTHLGCIPNKNAQGWLCPCHGSVYDNSGRIITGPAPRNLEVPPYRFLNDEKIIIG